MGKFLKAEKVRQVAFKLASDYFSAEAKPEGVYKGKPRPFCLPVAQAAENLAPDIRAQVLDHFRARRIQWHSGIQSGPSNHLCDSQVCCVNFLFTFGSEPDALGTLLRPVFPETRRMLPVDDSGRYVTFEWIGERNYLGEKVARGTVRTRGANATSADAIVMFERNDGRRQIVLIEWKYTESYTGISLRTSASGTDRTTIYMPLYEQANCPLDGSIIPAFSDLFVEPFYQFMRQQLLANEMEKAHELGAELVSVLHIAPAHNKDFLAVTSPALVSLGPSAIEAWKRLTRHSNRFVSVSTEGLFGGFPIRSFPVLQDWWAYIASRYAWVTG